MEASCHQPAPTSHVRAPPWKEPAAPFSLQMGLRPRLTGDHNLMRDGEPVSWPNSQKLWDSFIAVYCCLNPQRPGVTCCPVMYKFYTVICGKREMCSGQKELQVFKDGWYMRGVASKGESAKRGQQIRSSREDLGVLCGSNTSQPMAQSMPFLFYPIFLLEK